MTYLSGRGTARARDAPGTPTQSHISLSIPVYKDKIRRTNGLVCAAHSVVAPKDGPYQN